MLDVQRETATVVIVGAGVAGMTAAVLLRRCGVDCIVLERESRDYVEHRQRAGIVEYRAARMFEQWGLTGLLGDFPADSTIEVRVNGQAHLLGRDDLSRRCPARLTPQQVLVRNLIRSFVDDGGDVRFRTADVALHGLDTSQPAVTYTDPAGTRHEITCSFVAGCDGDHGICRTSVPAGAFTTHSVDYGITWLTVLAAAPPPPHPLMAASDRGFAAHFARGSAASRFYLQCRPSDRVGDWPDDRIWAHLRARLHRDDLPARKVTDRAMFSLRGSVCEPMSYGGLFLLGDAAHVVCVFHQRLSRPCRRRHDPQRVGAFVRSSEERASIRQRFLAVDSSNVADILDQLGLLHQGLAPQFQALSGTRLAGWAYTIRGQIAPYEGGGDPQKMQACAGVGPDEVSVWSGDGAGICYFGELIALGMMERGCVGALADGGVRDTRWLREHEFPVFATYRTPVQSIGRWRVTDWQQPVYLAGATSSWVTVRPGDFLLGDEDGCLAVPAEHVDEVLAEAEKLTATEVKIRQALRDGMSLAECLERFGHV